MITILTAILSAFAYRIRGGGWVHITHDYIARLVWGLVICLVYLFQSGTEANTFYAVALIPLCFISLYIPHAPYQNMGRWAVPQKAWPAFFLPAYTLGEWTALSPWKRTLNDIIGMACVGFTRGIVIFLPYSVLTDSPIGSIIGVGLITVLKPVAYYAGFYIPFTITSSLTKKSAQWGEFFAGAAWAVALSFSRL